MALVDSEREAMIQHIDDLTDEVGRLLGALGYCTTTLEMLCPDTAGTPAAVHARKVIDEVTGAK